MLDALVHLDARLGADRAARILDFAGSRWRPRPADGWSGFGDRIAKVLALAEETEPKAGWGEGSP